MDDNKKDKLKKIKQPHNRRDFITGLCFLCPSLIGVGLFFVLPFCVVVYYSLTSGSITAEFSGLDNYRRLFSNAAFLLAAKNTLHFSLLAVPLAVILSLGLAVMLEARIPWKSQFRTFFLSPMMVPVASVVLIWQVLFNYNGSVNELLAVFGVEKIDWLLSDHAQIVVLLLFLWKNLGYNMILFMAALANIPKELLEVADVEGAGGPGEGAVGALQLVGEGQLFGGQQLRRDGDRHSLRVAQGGLVLHVQVHHGGIHVLFPAEGKGKARLLQPVDAGGLVPHGPHRMVRHPHGVAIRIAGLHGVLRD